MAGNFMSPAERQMRETIEFLLALPHRERENMEVAKNFPFTMDNPAPAMEEDTMPHRTRSAAPSGSQLVPSETRCITLDLTTVEAALELCLTGKKPAVLNFAHGYNCGGGFEHAGGSQEEDLFRKTSLFLSLWPRRRSDDGPGVLRRGMWIGDFDEALARKEPFYPHSECAVIYTPYVRLVRNARLRGAPLESAEDIDTLSTFSVLTVAAQNVGFEPQFRPPLLAEKCRSVLWCAAHAGHDCVVLGAFGCGYFRNPPRVVRDTFADLLEGEFKGVFSIVVFAIPFGGPNFDVFAERFPSVNGRDPAWAA
jgi:hypothetical protein